MCGCVKVRAWPSSGLAPTWGFVVADLRLGVSLYNVRVRCVGQLSLQKHLHTCQIWVEALRGQLAKCARESYGTVLRKGGGEGRVGAVGLGGGEGEWGLGGECSSSPRAVHVHMVTEQPALCRH